MHAISELETLSLLLQFYYPVLLSAGDYPAVLIINRAPSHKTRIISAIRRPVLFEFIKSQENSA